MGRILCGDLIRSGTTRLHTPRLHFFYDDADMAHHELRAVTTEAETLYPAHGGTLEAREVAVWLDAQ